MRTLFVALCLTLSTQAILFTLTQNSRFTSLKYHEYKQTYFRLFSRKINTPRTHQTSDDSVDDNDSDIVKIESSQLLESWLKSGRSKDSFNVQQAILLCLTDDDEDEEGFSLIQKPANSIPSKRMNDNDASHGNSNIRYEVKKSVSSDNKSSKTRKESNLRKKNTSTDDKNKIHDIKPYETKSVGIDLGTTYSAISLIEFGKPKIIPVDGARIIPSIVGYVKSQDINSGNGYDVLVGELAKRQLVMNPRNTYASIKRLIGQNREQLMKLGDKVSLSKVDRNNDFSSNDIIQQHENNNKDKGQIYSSVTLKSSFLKRNLLPEEISSHVIKTLLDAATLYLNNNNNKVRIENAVITVPAYFLPDQCM